MGILAIGCIGTVSLKSVTSKQRVVRSVSLTYTSWGDDVFIKFIGLGIGFSFVKASLILVW